MSTALVTFAAVAGRCDLVVPLEVPVQHLVDEVAASFKQTDGTSSGRRLGPSTRWVIGRGGELPFLPERTLGDEGVLDGALLYIVDAYTTAPGVVSDLVGFDGADYVDEGPRAPRLVVRADSESSGTLRGGLEPTVSLLAPPIMLAAIVAGWMFFRPPAQVGDMGTAIGAAVVVASIVVAWWVGLLPRGITDRAPRRLRPVITPAAAPEVPIGDGPAPTADGPAAADDVADANGEPRRSRFWSEDARAARVDALVEQFIYDLGAACVGSEPTPVYLDGPARQAIQDWVAPLRAATHQQVTPDFGDWVDIQIDWGSAPHSPITVQGTFQDRSTITDLRDGSVTRGSTTIVLVLTLDPFISTVRTATIRTA